MKDKGTGGGLVLLQVRVLTVGLREGLASGSA